MSKVFTDANFKEEVLEQSLPVLVDFYADWCGPCRMMAPVIEQLASEYEGRLLVGKINVDENPDTASAYRVMSIPYLAVFQNGKLVNQVVGAVPKAAVEAALKSVLGQE